MHRINHRQLWMIMHHCQHPRLAGLVEPAAFSVSIIQNKLLHPHLTSSSFHSVHKLLSLLTASLPEVCCLCFHMDGLISLHLILKCQRKWCRVCLFLVVVFLILVQLEALALYWYCILSMYIYIYIYLKKMYTGTKIYFLRKFTIHKLSICPSVRIILVDQFTYFYTEFFILHFTRWCRTLSSVFFYDKKNYIISYIIAIACHSHNQIRIKPDKTALVKVTILDWDASYRTKQHNICVPPNQSLSELLQCEHLLTRIEVTESNCFLLKCFSMNFWIKCLWNVENVKGFVPYDT